MQKIHNLNFYGHGQWALNTLKELFHRKDCKLNLVISRFPNGDKDIELFCNVNGITYLTVENINDYLKSNELSSDLGISVSYDQIFSNETILFHKKGIINCHAGDLPDYKGRNVLNWAIINNLTQFGITVHYVDEDIDTGNIITKKFIPIKEDDDYNDLLLKAYRECPKLVIRSLDLIFKNKVTPIIQKEIKDYPIYCSRRQEGDELINWNSTSLEIYNFVRALAPPGPYAQTFIRNTRVFVKKAEYIKSAPKYKDFPGSILKKDSSGLLVKTGDSYIRIQKWDCDILLKRGDRFNFGFNYC